MKLIGATGDSACPPSHTIEPKFWQPSDDCIRVSVPVYVSSKRSACAGAAIEAASAATASIRPPIFLCMRSLPNRGDSLRASFAKPPLTPPHSQGLLAHRHFAQPISAAVAGPMTVSPRFEGMRASPSRTGMRPAISSAADCG